MATVLIVVYLLIVLALIVVILLQSSEGGGLGMGGGGGGGGLVSARGSANLLTRTTGILGTLFMVTAVGLTIVSQMDSSSRSILDRAVGTDGAPVTVLDALDSISGGGEGLALPADDPTPLPGQDPVTEDTLALPAAPVEAPAADPAPVQETPLPGGGEGLAVPGADAQTPPNAVD